MGDSLLRDRIVLGIKNEEARKRLLQQRKPDLKKCIDICRTSESATAHLQAIRGKHNEVDQVNSGTNDSRETGDKQRESTGSSSERKNIQPRKLKCKFCLQSHVLKKELCPAWGKRCNVCRKMNHWKGSEFCVMKKKVHSVDQSPDCSDSDVASVKTLSAFVHGVASAKDKPIHCEMLIRSKPVSLQVDCGATVSIIPKSRIGDSWLEPSNITLEM